MDTTNRYGNESVAVIATNWPKGYSGGRIHAMWIAYGLAANGYHVDFYTNCIPIFFKDFPNDEARGRIHFVINKWNLWRPQDKGYELIILVPHGARRLGVLDSVLFYPFAARMRRRNHCKMAYLDFESPNWIQEVDPSLRSMAQYKYSNKVLKNCDAILSTTKTGSEYAKRYYSLFNSNLEYYQLYLCINTFAAEDIDIHQKENSVLFIARFGQKHKGNEALLNIVQSLPSGYTLNIMGNKDAAEPSLIVSLENMCRERDVKLLFHKGISDRAKFQLMAQSKILFFSSKFEGYGIPPQEAQYMGCKVVCSDIPVLREVNPRAEFVDFGNKPLLEQKVNTLLSQPENPDVLRKATESFSSPKTFISNLNVIIHELEK